VNCRPVHTTGNKFVYCFFFPIFCFWCLDTFGDEVTKIRKHYVIFVYILQGKMEKKRKENHVTKVTKIPKTKIRKYGMNKKQNKIKNQSCISTEKSIKSLKKTKTAKANLFFFSKNHHHMNMIKMTGLKICNTTRESKREKKCGLSQSKIHCYIIHTIKFI